MVVMMKSRWIAVLVITLMLIAGCSAVRQYDTYGVLSFEITSMD